MNERIVLFNDFFSGTLAANQTRYIEFNAPGAFLYAKAWASNDSSATLALSGASSHSVAATAIGDSGDPAEIAPASTDVPEFAADELITITLDYDGAAGTAAANVGILLYFLTGEPAQ